MIQDSFLYLGVLVGLAGLVAFIEKTRYLLKVIFKDNHDDQNKFQGNKLNLKWAFTDEQAEG